MQPGSRRRSQGATAVAVSTALAATATLVALAIGGVTTAAATAAHAVQISGTGATCAGEFCYVPGTVAGAPGDTVTWTNASVAPHTVTRCTVAACGVGPGTGGDMLSSPSIASGGGSFAHTFSASGTYVYYCTIHGYSTMHGEVDVSGTAATPAPPAPTPTPAPTARPSTPRPAVTAAPPQPASPSATVAPGSPSAGPSSSALAVTLPTGSDLTTATPGNQVVLGTTAAGHPPGGSALVPLLFVLAVLAALGAVGVSWRRRHGPVTPQP